MGASTGGKGGGFGGKGGDRKGGKGKGKGKGGGDKEEWIPCTKLGRLVKDTKIRNIDDIYFFSMPIKEYQIIDFFPAWAQGRGDENHASSKADHSWSAHTLQGLCRRW